MPIQYIQGDLLTTTAPIIAHGVNCRGVMGAGVALAIADKWPAAKDAYRTKFQRGGWDVGEIQTVWVSPSTIVVNCATQWNYLPRGKDHFEYGAWRGICHKLRWLMGREGLLRIAMPRIGAGLARGDWQRIEPIIADEFADVTVSIYVL